MALVVGVMCPIVYAAEIETTEPVTLINGTERAKDTPTRLELVMGVWRDILQWVLDTWKNFEVFDGITIWNVITTAFVSFGVVSIILVNFGGTGIAKGVTDIRDSYESSKQEKRYAEQEKYNKSYAKYKETMDRNNAYKERYQREKGN